MGVQRRSGDGAGRLLAARATDWAVVWRGRAQVEHRDSEGRPQVALRRRVLGTVRWLGPAGMWCGGALACSAASVGIVHGQDGLRGGIIGSLAAALVAGLAGGRLGRRLMIEGALRRDLVTTQAANGQLRGELARDDLTGLPSRRHFLDLGRTVIATAIRYGQPLALLLIDLDRFKNVNDRFGHHGGDEALRRLADVLRHALRESDIAGRMGGDEFVVLMPVTPATEAAVAAHRVREVLAAQSAEPVLSISVGVAALTGTCRDLDTLLQRADAALYAAKRAGRARVYLTGDDMVTPTPFEP